MASTDTQSTPLPAHELSLPTPKPSTLHSSHGSAVSPTSTGSLLSTPLSMPLSEMRTRYHRDGYLWIKNLIPREDVLDMRERYFTLLSPTCILAPSTSPRSGIFNPSLPPLSHQGIGGTLSPETSELLNAIHADPYYRTFLQHPSLREFVRHFTGWDREILLERAMLRHNVPGSLSTGVHYDKYFLRGGDAEFLTGWVPLGDCAPDGGGLMYLESSNALGENLEADLLHKASLAGLSAEEKRDAFNKVMNSDGFLSHDAEAFARENCGEGGRWLVGDYEAGDVVFHRPFVVHAATRNEDKGGRIRLASDLRFYEEGEGVDERWGKVWRGDDGL